VAGAGREHEARGQAAHARCDYEAAVDAYEEAYAAYRAEGDLAAAARAARTVGWFRGWVFGEWAVYQGWQARGTTLLEQADDEGGRGWVALDEARRGNDLETQRAAYRDVIALAQRLGDPDLECEARMTLGMMLVFSDRVDEGMQSLDTALASICSGDVTELPVVEGGLCGLFTACERTGDVGRADEWLRSAERVMRRGKLVAVAGYCRAHYGGILVAAGRWADAEDELAAALGLLPDGFGVRANALCRLADLRVRQGRLEEAAQLLVGLDEHEDAVRPLVALRLARGEALLAVSLLERVLEAGPYEDHVAAPLLAQLVEARLAVDDVAGALAAETDLAAVVARQESPYLLALGAVARARACAASGEGDPRACWHQALSMFASARMPAEVAAVRLELAHLAAADRPTVAIAEAGAALRVLEELGDRRRADEAAALLRSLGATGPPGPKRRAELTRREEEVLDLLGHGLTNAEIGERLFISPKTAEHHVGRILSKLGLRSRTEAAAYVVRTRTVPGPQ
jgi:DNA-binding CsgD family transcriptional regulator